MTRSRRRRKITKKRTKKTNKQINQNRMKKKSETRVSGGTGVFWFFSRSLFPYLGLNVPFFNKVIENPCGHIGDTGTNSLK